jgi:hypothetical protein
VIVAIQTTGAEREAIIKDGPHWYAKTGTGLACQ